MADGWQKARQILCAKGESCSECGGESTWRAGHELWVSGKPHEYMGARMFWTNVYRHGVQGRIYASHVELLPEFSPTVLKQDLPERTQH